jgi:hypothetical protein
MDDRGVFMAADKAWESKDACARSFFAIRLDCGLLGDWGNKLFDRTGRFLPVPFNEPLQHFYLGPLHVFCRRSDGSLDETVATGSAMGGGNWNAGFRIAGSTAEDYDAS